MLLKENNPWVGLASYKQQDAARYYGREKDSRKLSELIQSNYCTVLYGKSGAGKTSLIHAGVCPILSGNHFLPIPLKLEHSGSISYARQIMDKVEEEFHRIGGEIELPFELPEGLDDDSRFWLFFHTADFWDGQNFRTTPVVFIDQFEEIFNLSSEVSQVMGFFRTIDILLQMTPPEQISEAFARNNRRLQFNERPSFRLVLSLREDFLARLEDYSFNIPALRRNRIGLASMNGLQALEVITRPMPGLVQRDAAIRILSKVTATDVKDDAYLLERLTVDSCILSLFCTEIYNKSAEAGKDGISMDIIEQFGSNIIQTYYERNMDGISSASAQYLESHLLTTNGFRNLVALEDLVPEHVKMEEIKALEANRIVRIETVNGTERVVFTHDVLCKVAADHRNAGNLKSEKRKTALRIGSYALEVLLHAGVIAAFLHKTGIQPLNIIRGHSLLFGLFLIAFVVFFLIRLEHHSTHFKSPLIMGISALFCLPVFILLHQYELTALGVIYFITGLAYPFFELGRQRRSQSSLFLRDSFQLPSDRSRWAAFLAFLILSYGSAAVFAHRMVNGTLSNLLLLFLPLLLLEGLCCLFPDRIDKRTRWICEILAEGGMLLLVFSQYLFSTFWYFISLLLLAIACICFFLLLKGHKRLGWLATTLIWGLSFLLLPIYLLGFTPSSIGDLARVPHGTIATESYPNMITFKDRNGLHGVVMQNEIILPMEYDAIRTYAKSTRKDLDLPLKLGGFDGTVQDLVFFVKEGGSDTWKELPLSKVYGTCSSISRAIADDYLHALEAADSMHTRLFQTSRMTHLKKTADGEDSRQVEIDFRKNWEPFMFTYDPSIQVFLTSQFQDDSTGRMHAEKTIVLFSALASVRHFMKAGGWNDSPERLLRSIAYADFYQHTQIISQRFRKEFNDFMQERIDSLSLLPKLLDNPLEDALQTILATPALRKDVYTELQRSDNRNIFFKLLSLQEPVTRNFLSRLIELEDSSFVNPSFYAMFRGDFTQAETLARQALESSEDTKSKGIAVSNLIPALFMNGKEEECKAALDSFAFYRTNNGYIVIDALYQDLNDYLHHGVFSMDPSCYDRYAHLLASYLDNIFRDMYYSSWRNAVIYYKDLERHSSHYTFKDATLYFDSADRICMNSLIVPKGQAIGIMILDGKKGYIDLENGEMIYPVQADHAWLFSEGLGVIEENNQIRVINSKGRTAFDKVFSDPRDLDCPDYIAADFVYHGGTCTMVDTSGRFGLIDTLGRWVIQPEYDCITNPDPNGYRHLMKDGLLYLLGTLELEKHAPSPSSPLIIKAPDRILLGDPRGKRMVSVLQANQEILSASLSCNRKILVSFDSTDPDLLLSDGRTTIIPSGLPKMKKVISPDASCFVSFSSDSRTAYFTDVSTGKTEPRFSVTRSDQAGFMSFVFSPDGERAASSHIDDIVRIWDTATGACIDQLDTDDAACSLDFSPDGYNLLVGLKRFDHNLILHRIGEESVTLTNDRRVLDVRFSHNGKWFATLDSGQITLYDTRDCKVIRVIRTQWHDYDENMLISPDDHLIATLWRLRHNNNSLSIWDVDTGDCLNTTEVFGPHGSISLIGWFDLPHTDNLDE